MDPLIALARIAGRERPPLAIGRQDHGLAGTHPPLILAGAVLALQAKGLVICKHHRFERSAGTGLTARGEGTKSTVALEQAIR